MSSSLEKHTLQSSSIPCEDMLTNSPEKPKKRRFQKTQNKRANKAAKLKQLSEKKLLVLDLNGILVDIVQNHRVSDEPFTKIGKHAVFKRPYCDDFLQFCFEHFDVGIWSSRTRWKVEKITEEIFGNLNKLKFTWNQMHCTDTDYKMLENRDKPLVLKELTKIWRRQVHGMGWVKGNYDVSNTLLIDDSPYKALCNPPNTGIFLTSYSYKDKKDDSLGHGGKLRVYLESIASCDHIQRYVEENPFNDRQIDETDQSWFFYKELIESMPLKKGAVTKCVGWECEDPEAREKHELKLKRKEERKAKSKTLECDSCTTNC